MPPQTPAPSLSWLEVRPLPPWEFLGRDGHGRSMWWAPAGTPPPGEVGPP